MANADTGNTSTLTFGTSGLSVSIKQITGSDETRESLEDSHLGTTSSKTFVPSDLVDRGEIEFEFFFDGALASLPAITGAAETGTISYPLVGAQSTRATLAGTGFFTSRKHPDVQNGTLMMGRGKFKWDGKTGPTHTVGS